MQKMIEASVNQAQAKKRNTEKSQPKTVEGKISKKYSVGDYYYQGEDDNWWLPHVQDHLTTAQVKELIHSFNNIQQLIKIDQEGDK